MSGSQVNSPSRSIPLARQRVHFVGVGGCGMSGLARMAGQAGARCSGSDMSNSSTVADLVAHGIAVNLQQTAASLPEADLVVISAAIPAMHPEVVEAHKRGIPVLKYAQMLGRLMADRTGIAVAGTHGKSSTTSMLGHVLIQAGLDPSVIVGANCPQIGGGWRLGASDKLVVEACEFDRSFHNYHPKLAAILNIEEDHLDVYPNLEAIVESFRVFAHNVHPEGLLLINHEMPHRLTVTAGLSCRVETIGFAPQADWEVNLDQRSMSSESAGPRRPRAILHHRGQRVAEWLSPLPGDHMAYNAAAAGILAHQLGASWDAITPALEKFQGLERRMQRIGQRSLTGGEVTVVDDYGHHPTEIDTTLRALRRHYQPQRLICVFQPHQHSRTRFLLDQFAASFSEADIVIVPQIYFVRDSEQERQAVSAADLVDRLRKRGRQALHVHPLAAIVEQLENICRPGDLLVTMGAGDVWKVARDYLAQG
ncbi:MAG: UDP-N-acetylmuramate--L-alanine ligase [Phycisphaeraceae bacterium]|nr:UDP-N-acetylmuramate--L-alanine ligase [Phycisphaeraceae bacterium]